MKVYSFLSSCFQVVEKRLKKANVLTDPHEGHLWSKFIQLFLQFAQ